jgi:hypothetical protein
MPMKSRLFLVSLLVLLLAVLAIAFAPLFVSNAVRYWVLWRARQEGFVATVDAIEAPFLRPLVIRQLQLKGTRDDALRLDVTATDVRIGLNLKHGLLHMPGRIIRHLEIGELHVELRRSNPTAHAISRHGWATLQRLLPENASISKADLRVENGPSLILLRDGFLSASQAEAGRFSAAEVMIASPWLRQTFSQLRGATHWQANRLTFAGLTLSRGLDLQAVTMDFSRIGKQRVGLQFDLDTFGGKIRGNISHEWRSAHSKWKIAGGANDISLAQTSDALGFADRVDGLLHAGNFTFAGNLAEPDNVIGSVWTELTGLTWRNRTAEAIMLGAALYSRQIQIQQVYIKQKTNQFTLSGEAAFPTNSSGWLSPNFRGNISASINQLGDFLALFGASAGDFAGKLTIEGAMDTRDRKFGGHLLVEGTSLTFFKTGIDSLNAKVNLQATELEIEEFELKRKNDSLSGLGRIDMSHDHTYSGTLDARADNLLDYVSSFAPAAGARNQAHIPVELHAVIDSSNWDAHGTVRLPASSPIAFAAKFPLRVGTDWTAFRLAPINFALDFPAVVLAKTPQLFHPGIFQDGILSGSISVSETLQQPRIEGDVQLVNGKISGNSWTFSNVTQASGHVAFTGQRASVEFLNLATTDSDLSLHGEIDFQDIDDVTIRMGGATLMFDLTSQQLDCINKIEIAPAALRLAPAVAELKFRGGIFRSDWTLTLQEPTATEPFIAPDPDDGSRQFLLCLAKRPQEQTLVLGASARAETDREAPRKKRQEKPQ